MPRYVKRFASVGFHVEGARSGETELWLGIESEGIAEEALLRGGFRRAEDYAPEELGRMGVRWVRVTRFEGEVLRRLGIEV